MEEGSVKEEKEKREIETISHRSLQYRGKRVKLSQVNLGAQGSYLEIYVTQGHVEALRTQFQLVLAISSCLMGFLALVRTFCNIHFAPKTNYPQDHFTNSIFILYSKLPISSLLFRYSFLFIVIKFLCLLTFKIEMFLRSGPAF